MNNVTDWWLHCWWRAPGPTKHRWDKCGWKESESVSSRVSFHTGWLCNSFLDMELTRDTDCDSGHSLLLQKWNHSAKPILLLTRNSAVWKVIYRFIWNMFTVRVSSDVPVALTVVRIRYTVDGLYCSTKRKRRLLCCSSHSTVGTCTSHYFC